MSITREAFSLTGTNDYYASLCYRIDGLTYYYVLLYMDRYLEIVSTPICIGDIISFVIEGGTHYRSVEDVLHDVELVATNHERFLTVVDPSSLSHDVSKAYVLLFHFESYCNYM